MLGKEYDVFADRGTGGEGQSGRDTERAHAVRVATVAPMIGAQNKGAGAQSQPVVVDAVEVAAEDARGSRAH